MSARGITIVGASAGSGKTHRLTREVTTAIDPRSPSRLPLQSLVAVTYTRKAHAELAARIKRTLVDAEAFDAAAELPLAHLGTVHSVCLRLLQEFALDAGLSPHVDVLAGDEAQLLREALEGAIGEEACRELDRLSARFELLWQPQVERFDWIRPVTDIMELARSNRIAPAELPAMANRSADGLLRLLPCPVEDGAALDHALAQELSRATHAIDGGKDRTKTTRAARDFIDECARRLQDGELRWRHWEKLARIETSAGSRDAVSALTAAARAYERHPRLHQEIVALTHAIYAAARVGLDGYQAWKRERRVVDFVDMVSAALDVIDHPRVASELADRLRLVVVDEFQDTSPIQLALFLRLHRLAGRSIWVGDRKQCIFEYAGADPSLMDVVARWTASAGGARELLTHNHRSRPDLVEVCSELFATALAPRGFTREDVVVTPARAPLEAHARLPPLGLFQLQANNRQENAEAVAEGVRRLLAAPSATPVLDRTTKTIRDLRAGDVAVLVATNLEAGAVAAALHARGIRVGLARAGLLSTPEGTVADAALRLLLDPHDSLSAAKIDALTGFNGKSPEEWLVARLRHVADENAHDASEAEAPEAIAGWRAALARVRGSLAVLSPREALEEALTALDVVHLAARWPDAPQRLANLEALRGLATAYEERAAQRREAATVAGLLRYFDDLRTERLRRDELRASDDQHIPTDDGAVAICTYHKSKGLEWPVVVLASLDRAERRHAFEVRPESDCAEGEFDPTAPLADRWIRYWPWPLGGLDKAPLAEAAERSPEGQRVIARESRERIRLLYVGFTRARDHLVVAARVSKGKARTTWLDTLASASDEPLVDLPFDADDGTIAQTHVRCGDGRMLDVPTRVWRLGHEEPVPATAARSPARWFGRKPSVHDPPPYWIAPSRAAEDWTELPRAKIGAVERIAPAIPIDQRGIEHDALGKTVHAFLAADAEGLSNSERLARAARLLAAAGFAHVLSAQSLLEAGDALRTWALARWPGAVWRREVPLELPIPSAHGERRVSGVIDLLLETHVGRVVIDHKTFPAANESAWRARVKEYLPQMAAYATAVARVNNRPVLGVWVHLPMGGGMVQIVRAD